MVKKSGFLLIIYAIFVLSCNHANYKDASMAITVLFVNESAVPQGVRPRKVYMDPYLLLMNKEETFHFTTKDVRFITVSMQAEKYHIRFHLKNKFVEPFYRFTDRNQEAIVAVSVNGRVNNLARINEPVRDGQFLIIAGTEQSPEVKVFLENFMELPPGFLSGAELSSLDNPPITP